MLATISQAALSEALQTAAKAVAKAPGHPMLAGALVVARDGTLEVRTTGDASVRVRCQASVEEEGATVLPAKVTAQAVKGMRDAPVRIESSGSAATVRCGRTTFRLNALAPDEFPDFPEVEGASEATLPGDAFERMAGIVARVASEVQGRPILSGVLVELADGRLTMTATDYYRVSTCSADVTADGTLSAVIPARTLQDVASACGGRDVTVVVGDRQARLSVGRATFVTRLLEGTFPNARAMIPASQRTRAVADAGEMAEAVRRASLVGSSSVRLTVGADEVMVEASSPDKGEAREPVSADVDGDSLVIALNDRFLLDGLASAGGEVSMGFDGPERPATIRSWGDIDIEYLAMPMRL